MDSTRKMTLQAHFAGGGPLRPIMTSLNGDNSWLLSFPRPAAERATTGKAYYHIVFEPWLNGPTSLLSSWIIFIENKKVPAIRDPAGIREVVKVIESLAAKVLANTEPQSPDFDCIFLGFHYLDHLHEPTLRLFDKEVPVIATPEAIAALKPWNHFTTIRTIHNFDSSHPSWQDASLHPGDPFPSWLSAVRLPGHHELNYVTAIIWTHPSEDEDEDASDVHEAILQTPHGTKLDVGPLQAFLESKPPTRKLAMLHGLKESRAAGSMNTYGAAGGLALYRHIGGAEYWVLTHHSSLSYSGIFMYLLYVHDTPRTVQWALEQEAKQSPTESQDARKGGTPNVVEVDNGGCLVLV
jgi:hypothetical protein